MVSAFDKYDTAIEKMKELKEGTEEYAEALDEANKSLMDLIEKNPSLAKYVTRGSGGLLEFSGREEILQSAKNRMNSSDAAANIAKIIANEAQVRSNNTNLRRDLQKDIDAKVLETSIKNGTYGLEQNTRNLENILSEDDLNNILQLISDNGGTLLREDLEKMNRFTDDQIEAIMENSSLLIENSKSIDDLNATNKLLLNDALRASLENKEDYSARETPEKAAIANLYETRLTDEEKDKLQEEAEDR